MKLYKINTKNFLIGAMLCSFLCAEIGFTSGLSYGGVTYNEKISEYISITNGIGFNAGLEKSIGPMLIGAGYNQQNYTENFESDDSTFKNIISASYATGYAIYPYEISRFRFWGGLQIGLALGGKMVKTEGGTEVETTMKSDNYKPDYGFLIGTDLMVTKHIGGRFSYYYGIAKVLKNDIILDIDKTNLNIMNVAVNAQLLVRF